MGRCVNSENGFIETIVPVARSNNFFGQSSPYLNKNLGFLGEGTSSTAAENECKRLRGVRFVKINGSSACVGFKDALAKQIRVITTPTSSVYAVRVDFERG